STAHAGVGGPNIAPPGNGRIADCVANAPGGPVHVLRSDQEAEHIPGCNMAFRKTCLAGIGGFDPQYRVAGDDVDVCWRLRERGWTLGFSPAAMVWHHRRNSVRAYWKQQLGYGKAEAMLEQKWPEKYNGAGHIIWAGRIYGKGLASVLGRVGRIYHGVWGSAPFQPMYQSGSGLLGLVPLLPEWYLVCVALAGLSVLSILWEPMLVILRMLIFTVGLSVVQGGLGAARASFANAPRSRITHLKLHALTAFLYLLQPLARLLGRLHVTAQRRCSLGAAFPCPRKFSVWTEHWQAPEKRLQSIEADLETDGA